MTEQSNTVKGRTSFDANIGGDLVHFINRNVSTYATESSGPNFDLVPVTKQKDIMINVARLHASQEYDRIMELVAVLQKQAQQIKRRLELTDLVHGARYNFQLYHNQCYWLVFDRKQNRSILTPLGPNDWHAAKPEEYDYLTRVKWLGDYTWIEVDENGKTGIQTL